MDSGTIIGSNIPKEPATNDMACVVETALQEGAAPENGMSLENSEYDSAGSYSEDEQNAKVRSRASDQDENSDAGGSVILEREEGDGQESVPAKRVDDDEDKKNPQYIPKRGTFYEHDDRTAEDLEADQSGEQEKENGTKKVWQDKKERWSHDRFNENEQAPKSKSELVNIYGYDIRNEEGPPRARRRRRYGRGPNKYTRNWEDEDAYNKPPAKVIINKPNKKQSRTGKNEEEFPPLVKSEQDISETPVAQVKESNRKSEERTQTNMEENTRQVQPEEEHVIQNNRSSVSEAPNNKMIMNQQQQQRIGSGRVPKPKKEIKDSDYRGFTTKSRQQRNLKSDQQKIMPPRNQARTTDYVQPQSFPNSNSSNNNNNTRNTGGSIHEMEKEMSKLSVDGIYKGGSGNNKHINNNSQSHRQGSVPPRLQNEQQKGSKRYSSMRQRSLPETNYQAGGYYGNDYSPPTSTQPLIHQSAQILPTTVAAQLAPPTLPPPPIAQQVPVTAAPLLQAPPFTQPFPSPAPPAAYLQAAGVGPPTFIPPPQQPQMINFVQGQAAFAPANFQGFQQPFSPVTQPTELYQPQGGITYYSTDQQVAQRPQVLPQKRPKAAIPIIAPPSQDQKKSSDEIINNGSSMNNNNSMSAAGSEIVSEQIEIVGDHHQ